MAPVLVTLNDLEGHSPVAAFSSAIRRTFAQYFTRFQVTARSHGPSATAGLLVFIGEVAYGRRTISGKLLAFGFVTTNAAFVKLL